MTKETDSKKPLRTDKKINIFLLIELLIIVEACNMLGSTYAVFAAVSSVKWHGAENFGEMALLFIAFPTFVIQAIFFCPISLFCIKKINIYNPKIYARWLFCIVFCIVLLLPAVTLVAIATGLIMTN